MATVLAVDEFGCVPDGRFLERVSITADTAALKDGDGEVRAADVGKNIAIPGAADLDGTISRLIRRTDVDGTMVAGEKTLDATFAPEHHGRFLARIHAGQRITVAGAGVGGSTLVTDVVKVVGPTNLELADASATSVSAVKTILNDPGSVALSDYARIRVAGVTVDLGDRTIGDGAMMVGSSALASETAKFSSVDLDKPVVIRAAGRHVTTIESFQSSTQVTLAAPAQRTVVDGLADVWRTDSRIGFEALLAGLGGLEGESAEIRFSPGVYDFTRVPISSRMQGAISLSGLKNLTLRGAGLGVTILRLMPDQKLDRNAHVVQMRNCTRLTLRDLSVHGSYLTLGSVNEQMHGIVIDDGSEEIAVDQVRVHQSAGDGVRLLSSADGKVRQVRVDRCQIVQNKRSGVAFQRAVEQVWVRGCYIEMTPPSTDSCLDFEPTGPVPTNDNAPRDIIIDSNLMVHGTQTVAVSLSGISGLDRLTRVQFTNNLVIGGSIFSTDIDRLTIQGNTVIVPESGPARIPLHVQRGGRESVITGNLLVNAHAEIESALRLSGAAHRPATRTLVSGNLCVTRSGAGIDVISANDIAIQGNMVISTGSCTGGVFVYAESSDTDRISIHDNHITAEGLGTWKTGVRVATGSHSIDDLSIVSNAIGGAAVGVEFDGKGIRHTPVCALNRVSADATKPIVGLSNLPEHAVIVGGAASRGGSEPNSGGGRHLTGIGDPTESALPGDSVLVAGNIGDIYQRLDGGLGSTLYVKEFGNGTTAGWIAK
ncbi:hypothetical protein AB0M80_35385 [Amycolatopsis sp. NPDC051045]|uniref:hypothetical protein n=1 Tax=Amycolatopsis sp. NPDC051045 TaxID=3156922 RepID=UPI003448CBF6